MHEMALAQTVLDTTISAAKKNGASTIKKVILRFGIFALVQKDQFTFCFDVLKAESPLTTHTELQIQWIPGNLHCQACEFEGEVDRIPNETDPLAPIFQCPQCSSYSTKVLSGTETLIDSIVV